MEVKAEGICGYEVQGKSIWDSQKEITVLPKQVL